jgi:hypothetical protein
MMSASWAFWAAERRGAGPARPGVAQAVRTGLVEPMNPVAQRLAIHAADPGRIGAIHSVQDRRQRQKSPTLIGVLQALRQPPKLTDQIVRPQFHRSWHGANPPRANESEPAQSWNPPMSQNSEPLVLFVSPRSADAMARSVWKILPYPEIERGEDQVLAWELFQTGFTKCMSMLPLSFTRELASKQIESANIRDTQHAVANKIPFDQLMCQKQLSKAIGGGAPKGQLWRIKLSSNSRRFSCGDCSHLGLRIRLG